ncbi:GATA transcription factor 9-like [Malania oleifera]|uniref:GATA transcription factor 9-like n=1 Tax=Malania oleifera TaxID=397392 RepID=UPI0025ADBC6A|nr:GATA transcription factor 9-like [Malania oleifera]
MDQFAVEDLLDFPNDDALITDEFFDSVTGNSTDSSTVTGVDSYNSAASAREQPHFSGNIASRPFADAQFPSDELCVPCDDLAELEWLSNFVEESFSSEDLQKLQLLSGLKAPAHSSSSEIHPIDPENRTRVTAPMLRPDVSVPGKARSKRSRAAPCDWSSRLLVLSPAMSSSELEPAKKPGKMKKRESSENSEGRKCLHCATEKTPQWRTGPMGPKTLCNACGVRFKSGRLVPEYRPAASPTFVSTKHSNSHRKVMELRRQKEFQRAPQQPFVCQNTIFGVSDVGDYLIVDPSSYGSGF